MGSGPFSTVCLTQCLGKLIIKLNLEMKMLKKYFLRSLGKYNKKNARKVNKFLDFDAGLDSLSIDYRDFGVSPSSAVLIASSKKDFKKSSKSDYQFIFYPRKGILFFNENGSSKGFGRGGVVALFKKRSLLTSGNFLFSSGSETQSVLPDSVQADPLSTVMTEAVFVSGPRPPQLSLEDFSGAISEAGEFDRFSVSSSTGDVLMLSVDAADNTNPLVRLVDEAGRVMDPAAGYNSNSASTRGYRSNGGALFAEVYAQHSYTGSYELQVERYVSDDPQFSIPQGLLIILDQEKLDSADHYASLYLYSDEGLIYVSFGSGLTDETKSWWEDVLAATDALIEPEFVIVPQDHPKSQLVLNHTSASSVSDGAAGIYQSPRISWFELADGSVYNHHRVDQQGTITLSEGVYSHASRFAGSKEAGWKNAAFHELGHALGLEHPHEDSDGDVDVKIDTNGTVMSYEKEQDSDGDPGYTELDIKAIQFVYGSESGDLTPSPLDGFPLLTDSREFDLSRRWKSPTLTAEWVDSDTVREPDSGFQIKTLRLLRSDGDVSIESRVWLEYKYSSNLKLWDSFEGYSEDFHDVLILGDSASFQAGEASTSFELPILAGGKAEGSEWIEITLRPEYPDHYSAVPSDSLRLTILDSSSI